MEPRYKPGDKVRVVDLSVYKDIRNIYVTDWMKCFSNKNVVISYIIGKHRGMPIYNIEGCYDHFLEDMFVAIRPCKFMTKH